MKKKTCETCDHPIVRDHGMQYVMRGECAECPDCEKLLQERIEEDRRARPAQYRPI